MPRAPSFALAIAFGIAAPVHAQPLVDPPGLSAGPPCSSGALPDGHLFEPLRADPQAERFAGMLGWLETDESLVTGGDDDIVLGVASFGGTLELARAATADCDGLQVGLAAGAISIFEMHTDYTVLLNTDYRVSIPVELRLGLLSARLRLAHQSSHLGDELLLAVPGIVRDELSYEWVDLVVAADGEFGRVYAGAGYILHSEVPLDDDMAFAGVELGTRGPGVTPTAAVHWQTLADQEGSGTLSVQAGFSFAVDGRIDLVGVYTRGASPYSQFFTRESIELWGLELRGGF